MFPYFLVPCSIPGPSFKEEKKKIPDWRETRKKKIDTGIIVSFVIM